jgi:hypothetical protein
MPALPAAKAKVMSVVLIHMLKAVVGIADEESSVRAALLAEMRQLVRMYLVSAAEQSGR